MRRHFTFHIPPCRASRIPSGRQTTLQVSTSLILNNLCFIYAVYVLHKRLEGSRLIETFFFFLSGLGVLFGKLQQGVQENRQVLTIARLRAEAEEVYGQRLSDIAPAADKINGGFSRDDGASVRKVRKKGNTRLLHPLLILYPAT